MMGNQLEKGHTTLSRDEREIAAIYWPQEGDPGHRVGEAGCTKIEAYDESGSHSYIPMLAVWRGDVIVARVPADQVSVHYKSQTT